MALPSGQEQGKPESQRPFIAVGSAKHSFKGAMSAGEHAL